MPMFRNLLLFIIILITLCPEAFSQEISTELDKRGGFKDIKLMLPVDSVNGTKLKKEFREKGNVHDSQLYEVEHPDYMTIGEIKVNKIELKTYKSYIYEITVLTEKDPRLMKAMENALGKASYDAKNVRYFWNGEKLGLTFESNGKNELKLVYKSLLMPKLMKEDKEKKIENISNDF